MQPSRIVALVAITTLISPLSSCINPCENEVLREVSSPDRSKRAVLFLRGCGATTDDSWQISILGGREKLSDDPGNAFVADTDHGIVRDMLLDIDWQSSEKLMIRYPARARVFHQATTISGVRISYEEMSR
jgi:hypothetical protein